MAEGTAGTFTQIPAATQFSVLYGDVGIYVGAPSDAEAVAIAKRCVNRAIARLNSRAWTWSRSFVLISLAAGENGREYAVTGNVKSPRSLELINLTSQIVGRLEYEDGKTFDRWFENRSASADPTHYTIFNLYANGYITLNAAQTSAFVARNPTMRFRYYKHIPILSADSDLLAGPHEAEEFVLWDACAQIAGILDPSRIGFAQERAAVVWRDLVRDDVRHDIRDFSG